VPVYVYRRWDGSTFETQQRMAEDALVTCPTTGQSVELVQSANGAVQPSRAWRSLRARDGLGSPGLTHDHPEPA
jgi:hypothetical protein